MTEKEQLITENIKQIKTDYPLFYKRLKRTVILTVLVPILLIWLSYRVGYYYILLPTNASEGELLSLWGSILSFISTLCLGALALWQNVKANNINNRLSLIEEERLKFDIQPFVIISGWHIKTENKSIIKARHEKVCFQISEIPPASESKIVYLTIKLTNTSNTFTMVNYLRGRVYNNDDLVDSLESDSFNLEDLSIYLKSGEEKEIGFYCTYSRMLDFNRKKLQFDFKLRNRFNDTWNETIEIFVSGVSVSGTYNNDWFIELNPQAYKIEKLIF